MISAKCSIKSEGIYASSVKKVTFLFFSSWCHFYLQRKKNKTNRTCTPIFACKGQRPKKILLYTNHKTFSLNKQSFQSVDDTHMKLGLCIVLHDNIYESKCSLNKLSQSCRMRTKQHFNGKTWAGFSDTPQVERCVGGGMACVDIFL